jgi:hypothetical protein
MANIPAPDDALQNIKDAVAAKDTKTARKIYRESLIANYREAVTLQREYSAAKKKARELLKNA